MFQNFFLPPFASRMGSSPGHCSTGRAQLLCVSLCPSLTVEGQQAGDRETERSRGERGRMGVGKKTWHHLDVEKGWP